MEDVVGAILAGGLGTRLRTVVSDRPKVLASVRGRPFLAYLLDQLDAAGIHRVVLMTGYQADQVQQAFGETYRGLSLDYSSEPAPLGTAGALRLALENVLAEPAESTKPPTRTVLVLNGDSYCETDLAKFRAFHEEQGADASLTLAHVSDTGRFGRVETTTHGQLVGFVEKQAAGGPGWINAGIYLFNSELIREIPTDRAVSLEREMFPSWLQHRKLCGFCSSGTLLDIGTPESYRTAEEFFAFREA